MQVYKITNRLNGKVYIGQTVRSLSARFKHHTYKSQAGCPALYSAIMKYGSQNFTIELIAEAFSRDGLCAIEAFFIAKYNALAPNGYNLSTGSGSYCQHTDETKRKIGDAHRGRRLSPEQIAKMSESRRGQPAHNKGKPSPLRGIRKSPEFSAKLSQSLMGHAVSPETRKNIGNSNRGVRKSGMNRPIICLNDGICYYSVTEAAAAYQMDISLLSKRVRGLRPQCTARQFQLIGESFSWL